VPDIYTDHPDVVRTLLAEGGFTCGVEPRILEGRDPDWTCVVDGQRVSGDVYIHERSADVLGAPWWLVAVVVAVVLVVVAAQTLAIVWLRRRPGPG
jgi:hypothetical protein